MFAYGGVWNGFHWGWLIPLAMMILCFIMIRRRKSCGTGGYRSRHNGESAREILDQRYALGEIGKEEYLEKKKEISFPSV
jgi:uncharacterized membrane protein